MGVAVGLLAISLLFAVVVVKVYALLIEPGHPQAFYDEAAQRIAPWCSHIAGTALFFAAGWLFAARRPDRNGLRFAVAFSAFYAVIDAAMVGFVGVLQVEFALSMLAKLAAATAGACVARRSRNSA